MANQEEWGKVSCCQLQFQSGTPDTIIPSGKCGSRYRLMSDCLKLDENGKSTEDIAQLCSLLAGDMNLTFPKWCSKKRTFQI